MKDYLPLNLLIEIAKFNYITNIDPNFLNDLHLSILEKKHKNFTSFLRLTYVLRCTPQEARKALRRFVKLAHDPLEKTHHHHPQHGAKSARSDR